MIRSEMQSSEKIKERIKEIERMREKWYETIEEINFAEIDEKE